MDKIKEQANIVSQLLFTGDTGEIYAKTLSRTWDILREIGILLWLVICLTFVGGEWFYRTAVGLGRSTRTWYIGLSEKSPTTEPQSMTSTGQALFDTLQTSTAYLLAQARQQLGIPEPEPKPTPAATTPPPPSQPPAIPAPAAAVDPVVPSAAAAPAAEDGDEDDLA